MPLEDGMQDTGKHLLISIGVIIVVMILCLSLLMIAGAVFLLLG
jgi:hypothetical protein